MARSHGDDIDRAGSGELSDQGNRVTIPAIDEESSERRFAGSLRPAAVQLGQEPGGAEASDARAIQLGLTARVIAPPERCSAKLETARITDQSHSIAAEAQPAPTASPGPGSG